jgi:hypothetical protein
MTLYRDILKQAWEASWRNKYLWFFGLFAAFLGGVGEYDYLVGMMSGNGSLSYSAFSKYWQTGIFSFDGISNFFSLFKTAPLVMLLMLLVLLLVVALLIFFLWLSVSSQAVLVNDSACIINSKKKNLQIGESLMSVQNYFWKVLSFNILARLLAAGAFIIISAPFLAKIFGFNYWIYGAVQVLLSFLFLILCLSLSFIFKYAVAYTVIKNQNFSQSFYSAWFLFSKNWLISIEMSIVLFLVNFAITLAIFFLGMIIIMPLYFMSLFMGYIFGTGVFAFFLISSMLFLLALIIAFGSWLSTFQVTAWTALFVRLVGKGGESKLVRVISGFKK